MTPEPLFLPTDPLVDLLVADALRDLPGTLVRGYLVDALRLGAPVLRPEPDPILDAHRGAIALCFRLRASLVGAGGGIRERREAMLRAALRLAYDLTHERVVMDPEMRERP